MNLYLKRILIVFSVALNIGFIISAAFFFTHQPPCHHDKYRSFAKAAVERLSLPSEVQKDITSYMDQFRAKREGAIDILHRARNRMLAVLAAPGPLDTQELEKAFRRIESLNQEKHRAVKQHVLKMRQRLGDKNGAVFFADMLHQIESDAGDE